jgi:hypothetical protein
VVALLRLSPHSCQPQLQDRGITDPGGFTGEKPPCPAYRDNVPALPWRTVASPRDRAGGCTIFAAHLPLRRYRDMPRLLWLTLRIRRQLGHSPGLLGYAMDFEIRHKTLWISSAWVNRTGLAAFDRAVPHRVAKRALNCAIRTPTFRLWTCPIDQLPVPWHETRARLEAVSNRS